MRVLAFSVMAAVGLAGMLSAQSPKPVVVPAMTPVVASSPVSAPENAGSMQSALKMLLEMKAANAETLRKQEATLLQLDDLEKAANELKIYSKRG